MPNVLEALSATTGRAFRGALAAVVLALAAAALAGPAAVLEAREDPRIARARAFLDGGEPEAALSVLEEAMADGKPSAEALLLRSTSRIMVGDLQSGFEDLERALKLDPGLRQGWLNLAGLEIAEGRYQAAYEALQKARELDPEAVDNDLNLGAVLVMQGQLGPARRHFEEHLRRDGSARAYYVVAGNYALGGFPEPAIEHLRRAVELDERIRLQARSDDRFLGLDGFQELLDADLYTPPPGAHTRAAAFKTPYGTGDNRLLYAVLEALNQLAIDYSPAVEATPAWALVWGEMRIKVYNQTNGTGVVSLSAPAGRFTGGEWEQKTQELFRVIYGILGE